MKKYYFTNQLCDRHEARIVQEAIQRATGIVLDNPFYHADGTPTEEIAQLDAGEKVTVSNSQIVSDDLKKIKESDGIVAYMKNYSLGSPMEIFYAHDVLAKPVYVICVNPKMFNHPWLQHCTNFVFPNARDFITYAKENLV